MKWRSSVFYTLEELVSLIKWMSRFSYTLDEPIFPIQWRSRSVLVGWLGPRPTRVIKEAWKQFIKYKGKKRYEKSMKATVENWKGREEKLSPQVLKSLKDADNVLRGGALKDSFSIGGLS